MPRAVEAGITVEHACLPEGRTIEADPDQLKQVLLNLLLNAYDAAPSSVVDASLAMDGGWLTIGVRDRGPGIPEKDLDRVFDLFYTTKPKGSGLGLAITSRIVQDHGGVISASNAPGGGALFEVKLPIRRTLDLRRDGLAAEAPAGDAGAPAQGRSLT
jgi:signal transduction histidine kinase